MPARRSDDPAVTPLDPAECLEYWTDERRQAANPAPMTRDAPERGGDDCRSGTENHTVTCNDTPDQDSGAAD